MGTRNSLASSKDRQARKGAEWTGRDRTGLDRQAWSGVDRMGLAGFGTTRQAGIGRRGKDRSGREGIEPVWIGMDRIGADWTEQVIHGRQGWERTGVDRMG